MCLRKSHLKVVENRTGMTVLELVVAVSIVGLLAAISLPAASAARESARRLDCSSRLRQLVVAASTYESAFTTFPADRRLWRLQVAGFMDSGARVFSCPSDEYSSVSRGTCNYLVNGGLANQGDTHHSAFAAVRGDRRAADAIDGLSNTAAFSERLVQIHVSTGDLLDRVDPVIADLYPLRFTWYTPTAWAGVSNQDKFLSECLNRRTTAFPNLDPARTLASGMLFYDHAFPPGTTGCYNGPPDLDGPNAPFGPAYAGRVSPASSSHAGSGCNVAFADGRVVFASSKVAAAVWRAVGSINGMELQTTF